ncbi:type II toxin-antitoxin system death-on-curing family toxin [Bacillus horti]|uniref:Death-on-curing protein n=1 Tax=Caldalkalibacillus horti TaxID=77523 RepID=A0ABT9W399_9BACI|nr:type II toxin-antitoxin system death-on-curing family toxin [Bacillus horti]MDQ0167725.1 death-on-curing protein [Bacillus horti]
MVKYLRKEEVLAGHFYVMKQMNDAEQAGVKDYALLDSALSRPRHSVFGKEAYPTLFEKAAALLESLVKNHCFYNGNKRTAYLAVKTFLRINKANFQMDRKKAVEFIVDIANNKRDFKDIVRTLKQHSTERR